MSEPEYKGKYAMVTNTFATRVSIPKERAYYLQRQMEREAAEAIARECAELSRRIANRCYLNTAKETDR